MKTIKVYDPPMCCSTGICGTEIDPDQVNFAGMLSQLGGHGIRIERFNQAQQPLAFAQNEGVRVLLERVGTDVLPVIFWDGVVRLTGRYPTQEERMEWFSVALGSPPEVVAHTAKAQNTAS